MGGIAGIVFSSKEQSDISLSLATKMSYRAIDGSSTAAEAGAAFVNLYRRPHCGYSIHPPAVDFDENVFVTSDSRIDNREHLLNDLGLQEASDHELIYRAWLKWGQCFAEKLLGDFAFAIYEKRNSRLLLGRDPLGVKPLFYCWTPAGLVFASEIAPLADLNDKCLLSEAHIKNFLLGQSTDTDETAIKGIFRVPAAHTVTMTRNCKPQALQYWDPYSIKVKGEASPEKLWCLLAESVRLRSRNIGAVGYACSGGLDSTSICYAAVTPEGQVSQPLRTFSIVFDETPNDSERSFIEIAVDDLSADAKFVDMSDYDPVGELAQHLQEQSRIFHAPGLVLTGELYRAAKASDCTAFMDGHGGDEVMSHGFYRLAELAREKKWLTLWRCTKAAHETWGEPRARLFILYFLRYCTHRFYRIRKRLIDLLARQSQVEEILGTRFQAEESNIDVTALKGTEPGSNADHIASVFGPRVSESLEILELAAARRGIEVRFPFFDRQLVEYALSLPESAKLNEQWARAIFRQALKGRVPDQIRLRPAKFDFTVHMARGLRNNAATVMNAILSSNTMDDMMNINTVRKSWTNIQSGDETSANIDTLTVWRSIVLYEWLRVMRHGA